MTSPVLQALVLCEQFYQDRETGKRIIAGTFNGFHPSEYPSQLQQTFAYICLTGVRSETKLELRFVDLTDNVVLIGTNLSLTSDDPVAAMEFAVKIPPLPFPRSGVYALELISANELLGSWRVIAHPPQKNEEDQP